MTGEPYALWARVRWISNERHERHAVEQAVRVQRPVGRRRGPAAASRARGARPLDADRRRDRLRGALSRSRAGTRRSRRRRTSPTSASSSPSTTPGYTTIHWRVRAIRDVGQFQSSSNGLPAVSYGPWSPIYTTVNARRPTDAEADRHGLERWDKAGKAGSAHQLTPGFAWTPSAPVISEGIDPGSSLYRVYIFTDKNCVNRIFTGSIVGSPAWAPRTSAARCRCPGDTKVAGRRRTAPPYLTGAGSEGSPSTPPARSVVSNETAGIQVGSTGVGNAGRGAASGAAQARCGRRPLGLGLAERPLLLDGRPGLGAAASYPPPRLPPARRRRHPRAPARRRAPPVVVLGQPSSASAPASSWLRRGAAIAYHDMAVPQDSCQAGVGMSFGKVSQPVVTSSGTPFLSGVGPDGPDRRRSGPRTPSSSPRRSRPGSPVVGATEVPDRDVAVALPVARRRSTSARRRLDRPAGDQVRRRASWYYRVRGVNENLPAGAQAMAWSTPVQVKVTGNRDRRSSK